MGRVVLLLILMSRLCAGVVAAASQPTPARKLRQAILAAHQNLIDEGWQPSPKAFPSPEEGGGQPFPLAVCPPALALGLVSVGLIIRRIKSNCR